MKDLGALLHEARQKSNLSLEEVENETRIKVRYLEAIEEGELQTIPGEVYRKGFLRLYAKAVGLNPDDVIAQYEYLKMPSELETKSASRKRRAQALRKRRLRATITLAVLVSLGVVIYLCYTLGFNPLKYFTL